MEVALHLLGVLDRVVEVVAAEHAGRRPASSPRSRRDEPRSSSSRGRTGESGGDRPLHQAHVVVADGGRDVRLVELLQQHLVEVLGGLGLLLERVQLRRACGSGSRPAPFWASMAARSSASRRCELARTRRAAPSTICAARVVLGLPDLVDLDLDLLHLGVRLAVLLLQAREVEVERRRAGRSGSTTRASAATCGTASRRWPRRAHLGRPA